MVEVSGGLLGLALPARALGAKHQIALGLRLLYVPTLEEPAVWVGQRNRRWVQTIVVLGKPVLERHRGPKRGVA